MQMNPVLPRLPAPPRVHVEGLGLGAPLRVPVMRTLEVPVAQQVSVVEPEPSVIAPRVPRWALVAAIVVLATSIVVLLQIALIAS